VSFCEIAVGGSEKESIQIKLLCGSDVLESFAIPGLWSDEDVSWSLSQGLTYSISCDMHIVQVTNVHCRL